jgi:hypothetical protein
MFEKTPISPRGENFETVRLSATRRGRVGDGQRFSFEGLKRNFLSENDITSYQLAFGKEAQTSYAPSLAVEFFYVPSSEKADPVNTTACPSHNVKAPVR